MKENALYLSSLAALGMVLLGCEAYDDKADSSNGKDKIDYVAPTGEPIIAEDLKWTWIDFPDSKCRDGSSAGIAVNFNSESDQVMVYLQGGGACDSSLTCIANNANIVDPSAIGPTTGIFDRSNGDNPVKDWNFIYVPYCTGDVHAGANEADPGTGTLQAYSGYTNLELFLNRVVPTFPEITELLYAGESAGGFGAAVTADLAARMFPPDVKFRLIDDSGPPMSSDYLPTCLQQRWRELWGLDGTFLADCGSSCPDANNYAIDWSLFLAKKFARSNAKGGIISATGDTVISLFYGFGMNDCSGFGILPAETFQAGLLDFRDRLANATNIGTYFIQSTNHTWIGRDDTFYDTTVNGVRLVDWVRDIIDDDPEPTHVGP